MEMNLENRLSGHEHFEELCALAPSGELAPCEVEELEDHLSECSQCRETLPEYQQFVRSGMPYLAAELGEHPSSSGGGDADSASKRELFRRLEAKERVEKGNILPSLPYGTWIGAVAVLTMVIVLTAVGAYRVGTEKNRSANTAVASTNLSLSEQLKSLVSERTKLDHEVQLRSARLDDLTKETRQQSDDVARLRELDQLHQGQYESLAKEDQQKSSAISSLSTDRESLRQQIRDREKIVQDLQSDLASLKEEHSRDLLRSASFETQIRDLSARLNDRDQTVDQQQQFLASDRDIRELMGARQLYIADVFDVGQDGAKKKTFGRVFYTKGKSLIFYAFDLDQQPGYRNAKAFQVWGTSGEEHAKAQSLGVFYMDSETNRRWAFKSEDPTVLAEVNAVFVTVEPKGESKTPTGKPFLYAYLRSAPINHP